MVGTLFVELVNGGSETSFDNCPNTDRNLARFSLNTKPETWERSELFDWKHRAASFH